MDTLFVAITGLSLLLVGVLGLIVARLLREERRRSDARVAALLAMSAPADSEMPTERPVTEPPRKQSAQPISKPGSQVATHPATHGGDETRRRTHTTPPSSILQVDDELELRPSEPEHTPAMFAQPSAPSPWSRRMVVVVPLALIVIGAAIAFYPTGPDIAAPEAPAAATASERAAALMPLELLSLRHTQQGDSLTVLGLVQNPRTAAPVSKVFATAFLFAADGTFLASGRAPLDFTTLGPGDESPFVITVPVKGDVARYRIGFRAADGRVIAHVDRRAGGAIARVGDGEQP